MASDRDAAWPAEHARPGACDVCERSDVPVVTWNSDDAPTSCEACFTVMREAWDEMTLAEQEAALNDA